MKKSAVRNNIKSGCKLASHRFVFHRSEHWAFCIFKRYHEHMQVQIPSQSCIIFISVRVSSSTADHLDAPLLSNHSNGGHIYYLLPLHASLLLFVLSIFLVTVFLASFHLIMTIISSAHWSANLDSILLNSAFPPGSNWPIDEWAIGKGERVRKQWKQITRANGFSSRYKR